MSIIQMSISAAILAGIILLIRVTALSKLPKITFLILWGIVLFRLLIPFSIPLPFNILSSANDISQKVTTDISERSRYPGSVYNSENKIKIDDIMLRDMVLLDDNTFRSDSISHADSIFTANVTSQPDIASQPGNAFLIIWLTGLAVTLIFFTAIYIRNHQELRFVLKINDNEFINRWLAEHKLLRRLTIVKSDRASTALAVGLIRPRIVLPKNMTSVDEQGLDYILTHEYYHIRRFDALWKMLLVLAVCLHWFNPMVWIMFKMANRDLELACDEMVLRRFGTQARTAYAYTLLNLADRRSRLPLYNGFSKNSTEERIKSIMKNKKTSLISAILAIFLIFIITVNAITVSKSDNSIADSDAVIQLAESDILQNEIGNEEEQITENEGNKEEFLSEIDFSTVTVHSTAASYLVKDDLAETIAGHNKIVDINLKLENTDNASIIAAAREAGYYTQTQILNLEGLTQLHTFLRQVHTPAATLYDNNGELLPFSGEPIIDGYCNNTFYYWLEDHRMCTSCGYIFTKEQDQEIGIRDDQFLVKPDVLKKDLIIAEGLKALYFTEMQIDELYAYGFEQLNTNVRQYHKMQYPFFISDKSIPNRADRDEICSNTKYLWVNEYRICTDCGYIFTENQDQEIGINYIKNSVRE